LLQQSKKKPPTVIVKSENNSAMKNPSIPIISTKLYVAELKGEYKVQFPDAKISSKSKSWLLRISGKGLYWKCHPNGNPKSRPTTYNLHVHSSLCHPQHILVDSTQLRAPSWLGMRTLKKRADSAHCDNQHIFVC
jgi:hypothetical protein